MKNALKAALALLLVAAGTAAFADENIPVTKDISLNVGYKLWLNNWQTWVLGPGNTHIIQLERSGYMNIPNVSLRFKQGFISMGYAASGTYNFPQFTDGGNHNVSASRSEFDLNMGYMFVPQVGATIGYKNLTEDFTIDKTNTKAYYNGVTFGLTASAPVGRGFSIYGNGVGGFMIVSYSPVTPANDTANYAASELGVAWRAPSVPLSLNLGYKYQVIYTHLNASNNYGILANQTAIDLTSGYILGINYQF